MNELKATIFNIIWDNYFSTPGYLYDPAPGLMQRNSLQRFLFWSIKHEDAFLTKKKKKKKNKINVASVVKYFAINFPNFLLFMANGHDAVDRLYARQNAIEDSFSSVVTR